MRVKITVDRILLREQSGSTSTSTLAPQKARKLMERGAAECTRAPGPKWKGVKGIGSQAKA